MSTWLAIALCAPQAAASEFDFRNRTSVGVDSTIDGGGEEPALRTLFREKLTAPVFLNNEGLDGAFLLDGRLSYNLGESTHWDETRVRDARLHLVRDDQWELDLGRLPVDGGFRIVDGAMVMASVGHGWWLGGWAGSGADPYSTLPLGRYGGGPAARHDGEYTRLMLLGEVLVAPEGLDRASVVATLEADPTRRLNLSSRVDLQYGGPTEPVGLADGTVQLYAMPADDIRVNAFYDAYSALAYLSTERQDPGISRFAQRSVALTGDLWNPQDATDTSLYHTVGGGMRWLPEVNGTHTHLGARARYRHHAQPDRVHGRLTLSQGATGLAEGMLDLSVEESATWWGGSPGGDVLVIALLEPIDSVNLALDASLQAGVKPLLDMPEALGSFWYADTFIDWISPKGQWMLAGGYGYTRVLDVTQWDQGHAILGRLTWNVRGPARPERQ